MNINRPRNGLRTKSHITLEEDVLATKDDKDSMMPAKANNRLPDPNPEL